MPKKTQITALVYNRTTQFLCSPETQIRLKSFFQFRVPNAEFIPKVQAGIWDGYISMMRSGTVGTGLFLERRKVIEAAGFVFQIIDKREMPPRCDVVSTPNIRPYQQQAVDAMLAACNTGGLITSATGTGKTFTAGEFFRHIAGNVCFVVDELALLKQAQDELQEVTQEPVGSIGQSKVNIQRVTVATIQTLHRHRNDIQFRNWFRSLRVLIVDEVHLALNKRNSDVVKKIKPHAVFGLTATLQIQKPEVLFPATALAGPVIFDYPISKGTEEGYLTQGVSISLQVHTNARRGPNPKMDYKYSVVLNKRRNDCIEALIRYGLQKSRRIIVILDRLRHIELLHQRLADIPHGVISGAYAQEIRTQARKDMDAGKLHLIIASRVFSKGVNIKTLDTIIDATGLPNQNAAVQRFGRGVRKATGKRGLVHIDITDMPKTHPAHQAGKERAAALRAIGIKMVPMQWGGDPSTPYLRAEGLLSARSGPEI